MFLQILGLGRLGFKIWDLVGKVSENFEFLRL